MTDARKPPIHLVVVLVSIAAIVLLKRPWEGLAMRPAPDILRLEIPEGVGVVTEHHAEGFQVAADDWILSGQAMDSRTGEYGVAVFQGMARRNPEMRESTIAGPDGIEIHRFARADGEGGRNSRIEYLVSFRGEWLLAFVNSRRVPETFDPARVDALIRGLRLRDEPRLGAMKPRAWEAYQAARKPGDPIAKMVLFMPPAPVRLGDPLAVRTDGSLPQHEDYERGGRVISPELIEFYTKGDPSSIRIDVSLHDRPAEAAGELVFDASLRLVEGVLAVSCADAREAIPAKVPPGRYRTRIWVVNNGVESERSLTDGEWFDRDDLERYEVHLTPRPRDEPDDAPRIYR